MYKLYLCLQYLLKRALAYVAMVGVALCVFMMLVVISLLDGFVGKIEKAAKGLFGDVVISSSSLGGVAYYDEFIADMKRKVPGVEAASPFILTFGILQVPGTEYRRTVQIAGIRLPERADVSDFEEGLFVQKHLRRPTFDPPEDVILRRLGEEYAGTRDILNRISTADLAPPATGGGGLAAANALGALALAIVIGTTVWVGYDASSKKVPTGWHSYSDDAILWVLFCSLLWLFVFPWYLVRRHRELRERQARSPRGLVTVVGLGLLAVVAAALVVQVVVRTSGRESQQEDPTLLGRVHNALSYQELAMDNFRHARWNAAALEQLRKAQAEADEAGNLVEARRLEQKIAVAEKQAILPPERRAILGLGIPGLTSRTSRGETVRTIGPGQQVVLSLIPLGRGISYTDITPSTRSFTVIDDCATDVSSIDSEIVYVQFAELQKLNNMAPSFSADEPNRLVEPARCSQIHVQVSPELSRGSALVEIARQIDGAWAAFEREHPDAARHLVYVQTWRQSQSRLVNAMEAQRTVMWIVLGIVSFVAVLLIFVIFLVIVAQKTRDIGVLKAVGASSAGVAGIFLGYGAAVGLVGSIVGTLLGYLVVRNINPIHDWVARTFGLVVWSRETFMFEKIPNEVSPSTALTIVVAAITSGILGSLVPAMLAACRQPVEALRYE